MFTDLVREDADFLADVEGETLRRAHFRVLQETVATQGGYAARNLGDGLLVVFPSAVQAVRTAVALQQAVDRHNRAGNNHLDIRVGLHVGEPIGDEADYFGRPVVAARHVCASAQPGQIVGSHLVRSLVGGRGEFRFVDCAPLTLPGLAEPLATVEVEWHAGAVARARTAAPLPPALADVDAFVGRDAELAKLRDIWQRTKPGTRPQVAMVAGEPGVGKTRLAAELAREAHADGALVLFGRCDEEPLTPYDPVVQALTWYVDNWPPAEVAAQLGPLGGELTRLVPLMSERVPGLTPPPQGDADTDRYRLFEAVSGLLENISRDQPVVLVLDDLQWADKATLLLLRHIVRSATGGGLLAVGTYRDVDLTRAHPLVETLADLRRQQVIERIALTGLGRTEVAELLGSLTSTAMSPDVADALHRETEGNPFFLREMLQHLIDTRTLAGDGPISVEDIGVPESVRELIGRRLLRLSNETNDLLAEASAIGRQFDLEILAAVNGRSAEEVLETLEEAMTARLVREVAGQVDRFAFSHVLVHETLYLEVSTIRRARLHGRVAAALEERYGDDPSRLAELAHHYYEAARAGVTDKAVAYCRRAGDRALSHLAYEEAARHYERALQVLELESDTSDQQRGLLHVAAGEAWRRAGERDRSRAAFLRAIDIGRALTDAEIVAEAALGLGTGLSAHESFDVSGTTDDAVVAVLEEALALTGDEDTSVRARLLGRLAVAVYWVAPRERRQELSEAAVAMAERTGDEVARVATLVSRYYALWGPEYMEDRLRSADEILRIAQRTGQTKRVLDARLFRIMAMFELGDIQQADAEIAAFRSEAAELRQPYYLWYAAMVPATRALLEGSFTAAEKLAEEALAVGERAHDPAAIVIYGAQMLWSWREQGRTAELEVAMGSILDVASAIPIAHVAMAWVSAELGQLDDARKQLESLKAQEGEGATTHHSAPGWMAGTMMKADLAYALEDADYAAAVYGQLQQYAGHTVMVWLAFCGGPVDYYLGLLAATMGDADRARNHFDSAGRLARAMGAKPMVAHIEHAHATLLLREGTHTGDPDPAMFIDRAGSIAEELGMVPLAAAVEGLRGRY